ncbi:endonuclease/exonuclease/phosphatase family protein [Acanthamoeba castellanii str. Neff]|uniref:Endonuclease/exonuclease/phosphatase family protein n=1 Tax=Acanthamoeba castellanii (strain ATCC 30010 / Neff) TaxID=1257118 RepID=L8GFP9_ACACF|nr:endonuclease/exonuclease/phosphatase family protein [Acanthamoeba castellanii str. Neff]ELR11827.1 endonuclease/exonuclease/phosphatase family protein [Acanthamoeba castellanii str. Neff]
MQSTDVYHTTLRTTSLLGVAGENAKVKRRTLNINDAVGEEKVPGFEFKKRLPGILGLIREQKPDLLFLVEATQAEHINLLGFELSSMGFRVVFGEGNASPGCTANVIGFNSTRFHLTHTENIQLLSDDPQVPGDQSMPNGWGANLFVARVLLCHNSKVAVPKRELLLGVTHFPIHAASGAACTEALRLWLQIHDKQRYIVSGDLNTFHDKGGPDQIAKLRAVATVEGESSICHATGRKVLSTYFGFPHDKFKFDIDKFLDPLDYVIINPVFGMFDGPLFTDTRFIPSTSHNDDDIENASAEAPLLRYTSDHLPLFANLEVFL